MDNSEVKTHCDVCNEYHPRRVRLVRTNAQGTIATNVCGECALVVGVPAMLKGERVSIQPSYYPMINAWTLGNGRYVADSGDARIEQTRYQNACIAFAERVGYRLRRAVVAARVDAEREAKENLKGELLARVG